MKNITKESFFVKRSDRERLNGHRSKAVWLTGLSGSGKSTLARYVEKKLFLEGFRTFIIDGDNIRHGLSMDLGFSPEDRTENIRRVAEVARLTVDAGIITLVALISPLRSDRILAKNIINEKNFIEIFCNASIEVCEKRDVKGLYKKARSGQIKDFTGISAPYESPDVPDLVINTGVDSIEKSSFDVTNYILSIVRL